MTSPNDANGKTGQSDQTGTQDTVASGPKLVVNIHKTYPGANTASPEAVCDVGNAATFREKDLGHLREYLNSMQILKPIE